MSDVSAEAPATEQTGAVNPVDQISAMIAANRRNNPQPDGSQAPPAGQVENKPSTPEAAPREEAEPEDSAVETTDSVEPEQAEDATDGRSEEHTSELQSH